jgi:hypothetical protein
MGSVLVRRKKRAGVTDGPQTFRSPTALVIWWVWLLFAAANLIDLAVQGRDHESLVAAAILVMVTGVAYVTAQRPRIIVGQAGVTVANPLRDHHVGWANVIKVDLIDLLRLHCQRGPGNITIISAWAVHYSRRRKLTAQAKLNRQTARGNSGRSLAGSFGVGGFGVSGFGGGGRLGSSASTSPAAAVSTAEAEAERIADLLRRYATAARAETMWAEGTASANGTTSANGTASANGTPATDGAAASGTEPVPGPEGAAAAGRPATPAEAPATVAEAPGSLAAGAARDPRLAGWLEPLRSTWSGRAVLALVIPALLLVVAIFA